ncbi:MAG: hypothetical protein IPG75_13780 [Gemmatimonadetes bacterium]|nr:hypothetical protein [Gemmatimonadota bacterium]
MRFETAPGEQAQVDFAHCRLPWGIRYALIVVLGYSRLLWVRFYPARICGRCSTGLAACLDDWGGVPRHLLFDQMRASSPRDDRLAGGGLLTNPECQRFAQHYGSPPGLPALSRPDQRQVERPIRYRGAASSTAAPSSATLISMHRSPTGSTPWPIRGCTAPPGWSRGALPGQEQARLQPLPLRPYVSLLPPPRAVPPRPLAVPQVVVEHRSLAAYAALAGVEA